MRTDTRWTSSLAASLALTLCVTALPARAEETPEPSKGWEFAIVPYIWGAGIEGEVGIGSLQATGVEASFSDIWDHLEIAGMATFEARKNRWGVLVDAIYIDLSDTVPTPQAIYGDADVSLNQQLYTGLVTYRIHDGEKTDVDLAFGTRYTRIGSDLELTAGIAPGRTVSGSAHWWDWLAGARIIGHPGKRWTLMGYADIGGGGSELTWEAVASAGFAFNKTVSLAFGYRYLSIDYDEDSFLYDVEMQGPFVGVGFHF